MRILGYVLLLGGFLWLARDAFIGFAHHQYATTLNVTNAGLLPYGDPVRRETAYHVAWELYDRAKARYRLALLPACLMLAGGLVLGKQTRRKVIVERIYTSPPSPEIISKLAQIRAHPGASQQPAKTGFRRALLKIMRRTVATSTYFSRQTQDEHSGTDDLITKNSSESDP